MFAPERQKAGETEQQTWSYLGVLKIHSSHCPGVHELPKGKTLRKTDAFLALCMLLLGQNHPFAQHVALFSKCVFLCARQCTHSRPVDLSLSLSRSLLSLPSRNRLVQQTTHRSRTIRLDKFCPTAKVKHLPNGESVTRQGTTIKVPKHVVISPQGILWPAFSICKGTPTCI